MAHEEYIDRALTRFAIERFRRHAAFSLRDLQDSGDFRRVSARNVDFLVRNRNAVLGWLDDRLDGTGPGTGKGALGFFVERMAETIARRNQFLALGPSERDGLAALYGRFLDGVRRALLEYDDTSGLTAGMERALSSHQRNLAGFSHRLVAAHAQSAGDGGGAVCAEYPPALQFDILGIDPATLIEPVLDLGCGETGTLVRRLRSLGKRAFGVDRLAVPGDFISRSDWFDFPLGRASWGTIISHMGFSNHFLHHHLRANGNPERHARRYMEILESLRLGGTFVYTPGLPFIEHILPRDRWTVERRILPDVAGGPADVSLARLIGESVFYSCRVTRIP